MIAAREECCTEWVEGTWFVLGEMTGEYQVQSGPCLGVMVVVVVWAIPAGAACDLLGSETESNRLSWPACSAISIVAPSRVPRVSAPFIMNFIFPVPMAS